jgi:hypothetical protein
MVSVVSLIGFDRVNMPGILTSKVLNVRGGNFGIVFLLLACACEKGSKSVSYKSVSYPFILSSNAR